MSQKITVVTTMFNTKNSSEIPIRSFSFKFFLKQISSYFSQPDTQSWDKWEQFRQIDGYRKTVIPADTPFVGFTKPKHDC